MLNNYWNRSATRSEHSLAICTASNSSPSSKYNRATRSRRDRLIQFFNFATCPCALCCRSITDITPTQPVGPAPFTCQRRPPYLFTHHTWLFSPCVPFARKNESTVLQSAYRSGRTAVRQNPVTTYSRSCALPCCSTYDNKMILQMQPRVSVSPFH